MYNEPFLGHSQIRIEIITTEVIADAIVDYCRQPRFEKHAVTAYFETVRVRDASKFIA